MALLQQRVHRRSLAQLLHGLGSVYSAELGGWVQLPNVSQSAHDSRSSEPEATRSSGKSVAGSGSFCKLHHDLVGSCHALASAMHTPGVSVSWAAAGTASVPHGFRGAQTMAMPSSSDSEEALTEFARELCVACAHIALLCAEQLL